MDSAGAVVMGYRIGGDVGGERERWAMGGGSGRRSVGVRGRLYKRPALFVPISVSKSVYEQCAPRLELEGIVVARRAA